MNISIDKKAGTPRPPQLTPQTPTYPSGGKTAIGIIKLYQSRCFYIYVNADFDTIEKALPSQKRLKKA